MSKVFLRYSSCVPVRIKGRMLTLYVTCIVLLALWLICLGYPDTLHHPDNYCYVDRYNTPQHIVPEWYFLPFYAMLRACTIKGLGVLLLIASLLLYISQCICIGDVHSTRSTDTIAMHYGIEYYDVAVCSKVFLLCASTYHHTYKYATPLQCTSI